MSDVRRTAGSGVVDTALPSVGGPRAGGRFTATGIVRQGRFTSVEQWQDQLLGRLVAAKQVRSDLPADLRARARSLLDAEAAHRAGPTVRGLVPLWDVAGDARGPVLLGPWLPASLAGLVVGEPHHGHVLRVLGDLACTLDALHDRGLWFGDLSLGNVLLDETGRALLGDLGSIRVLGSQQPADRPLDLTPAFAAPEVWRNEPASPASDVYALAVTAFWLLTGRLPFDAAHPDQVRDLHLAAARPSARDVTPGLPAAADHALAQGLAPRPSDRPPTCAAFLAELTSGMDGEASAGGSSRVPRSDDPRADEAEPATAIDLLERFAGSLTDEERRALALLVGRAVAADRDGARRFVALAVRHLAVPAALQAAEETGLSTVLVDRAGTAGDLAVRSGLDADRVRTVLDCLAAAGYVERQASRYSASAALSAVYGPMAAPQPIAGALRFWDGATTWLRTGSPAISMLDTDGSAYAAVSDELAAAHRQPAAALAARLVEHDLLPSRARVVDIGAGSGVWGTELLERAAEASLVLVDRPRVQERAMERAEQLGLATRVRCGPTDWRDLASSSIDADIAVLANVCHVESSSSAAALVAAAAGCVVPGGAVVVVDTIPEAPGVDLDASAQALQLGLRTGSGTVHSELDYRRWFHAAGLAEPFPLELEVPGSRLRALVGRHGSRAG